MRPNITYGELFDLHADPGETHVQLKADLVLKLLHAEMGKEPLWMPRIWGGRTGIGRQPFVIE